MQATFICESLKLLVGRDKATFIRDSLALLARMGTTAR